jgi:hypothetical protein
VNGKLSIGAKSAVGTIPYIQIRLHAMQTQGADGTLNGVIVSRKDVGIMEINLLARITLMGCSVSGKQVMVIIIVRKYLAGIHQQVQLMQQHLSLMELIHCIHH